MNRLNYALLALPLSCFGIPIYLHLASFYINQYEISLAILGLIIFACRLCDAIFDPLNGMISDYFISKKISRKTLIYFAAIPLLITFYMIFNPPQNAVNWLPAYIAGNLLLLYFSFSFITINYETLVSEIAAPEENFTTKLIAARESMQVLGLLLISILPTIISVSLKIPYDKSLSFLWIIIFPICLLSLIFLSKLNIGANFKNIANYKIKLPKEKSFWQLSAIYLLNSIAVSLPAVTIRFYVDSHLKHPELNGYFLGLYFLSAAIAIFFSSKLIAKLGEKNAWLIAIIFSVFIFIFAAFINESNYQLFYLVCLLSGFSVGCDLTAPQSILIKIIDKNHNKTIYFAIFSFITKISLAFATFIGFLFISNFSFDQNHIDTTMIPIAYAIIPCIIKLITAFSLYKISFKI